MTKTQHAAALKIEHAGIARTKQRLADLKAGEKRKRAELSGVEAKLDQLRGVHVDKVERRARELLGESVEPLDDVAGTVAELKTQAEQLETEIDALVAAQQRVHAGLRDVAKEARRDLEVSLRPERERREREYVAALRELLSKAGALEGLHNGVASLSLLPDALVFIRGWTPGFVKAHAWEELRQMRDAGHDVGAVEGLEKPGAAS